MEWKYARDIAVKICYALQPYCDKINIAGSIRRKKPEVKDIEIVCCPKKEPIHDMFNQVIGSQTDKNFTSTVKGLGKIKKGNTEGKYMAIELPEGLNLDLFMPDDFDFVRQYVIRTGSADYVAKNIAAGWKRKGWCGSDVGLRLIKDCVERRTTEGKSTWKCVKPNSEKPPAWKDEKEFFQWLNIPYIEPQNRI